MTHMNPTMPFDPAKTIIQRAYPKNRQHNPTPTTITPSSSKHNRNDNHNKYILWYTTLGRNEANQKRLRDTTTTAHLEHYSKRPTVSAPQYYGHGLLLYEANMIAITSKGPAIPHHSKYYPTLRVIPAKQHIWWRLVWWKWRNGARRNRILWLYLE